MRIKYRLVRATIVRDDIIANGRTATTCPLACALKRKGITIGDTCGILYPTDCALMDIQLSDAAYEFVYAYDSIVTNPYAHKEWHKLIASMPLTVTVFVPEVRWQTHHK